MLFLLLAKIAGMAKMIAVKKCGALLPGKENSVRINLVRSAGSLIVSAIIFLFAQKTVDASGIRIALLSGLFNALLLFSWILAAEKISLSLLETACMIGAVAVPLLLAPLLYAGERVRLLQWLGALGLFGAVLLLSPHDRKKKIGGGTVLLLFLALIANAGCVITQKLYVTYSGGSVAFFNLGTFSVVALLFFALRLFAPKKGAPPARFTPRAWGFLLLATVMLYANQFLQTEASRAFSSAVLYPLSYGIGIPMTFLTDLIFFKEKATLPKILGVCCAVLSVVLVTI